MLLAAAWCGQFRWSAQPHYAILMVGELENLLRDNSIEGWFAFRNYGLMSPGEKNMTDMKIAFLPPQNDGQEELLLPS